jgi:DNA-binding LytR/AlgR family response regulator
MQIHDVAYFHAEDNEVFMISKENRKMIIDYSLDQLEQLLDPWQFYRLNRSYIANIESIGKIHKYFSSRLKVELIPVTDDTVLISRVKVPDFLNWMDR